MNRRAMSWAGLLTAAVLWGCAGRPTVVDRVEPVKNQEESLKEASRELDLVARYLEKWGSISISAPVASMTGKNFQFDPKLLADDELFKNNRLMQGFSRSSIESVFDVGAGVKLEPQIDPVPEAEEGTEPGPRVEPPAAPASAKAALGAATAIPGNPTLTPSFGASQRATIRQTASDRFELGLHKFLSNPTDLPRDCKLVYMVLNVACQPGELTQRGYIGQVDVRVDWDSCESDSALFIPPRVVAVYPSMDSQGLDLRTSRRELIAAAFNLAAAGKLVGAAAFLNAASRSETDAETMSSLTSVTSYSRGSQHFGFELGPAFFGKLDPASRRAEAGYRLEPVTFPVVVLLAMDARAAEQVNECVESRVRRIKRLFGSWDYADDAELQLSVMDSDNRASMDPKVMAAQRQAVVNTDAAAISDAIAKRQASPSEFEALTPEVQEAANTVEKYLDKRPKLNFVVTQSWRPMPGVAGVRHYLFGQDDVYAHAINADNRLHRLKSGDMIMSTTQWNIEQRAEALLNRSKAMLAQLHPAPLSLVLPELFAAQPLRVESISPAAGRVEQSNVYIIRGQGFTDSQKGVATVELFEGQDNKSPSPDAGPFKVLGVTEDLIAIAIDDTYAKARRSGLTFRVRRDGQETFTPAFSIAPAPEAATKLTVTRDAAGKITGAAVPQIDPKRAGEHEKEIKQIIEALKALGEPAKAEQPKTGGTGTGTGAGGGGSGGGGAGGSGSGE